MTKTGGFLVRIVRIGAVFTVAVGLSWVAPVSSHAKLRASEKPFLVELLSGTFNTVPRKSTVACVANRLSAGTIDEVLVDASFFADPKELADSIAFRRTFKAIFACRPPELARQIIAGMSGSLFTSKQKSCIANGLMTRIGTDEEMLTLVIRGGLDGLNFDSLDIDKQIILERNVRLALRPCVRSSLLDEYFDDFVRS